LIVIGALTIIDGASAPLASFSGIIAFGPAPPTGFPKLLPKLGIQYRCGMSDKQIKHFMVKEKRFSEQEGGTTSINIGTGSSKPPPKLPFKGEAPPFKKKSEKEKTKEKEAESRATAALMRMVTDYERSVRERRL
jgi:hypothetical protein